MTLHRLLRDIVPAHKRISYDEMTAVKIMDEDNREIAIFIITHMLNTCRDIIIQGVDGKNILPSVFKIMGLIGVILSDKMIQHLVPEFLCHRAEYSIESDFPAYLTFNKNMGKTCFILTCPQIGSTLVRPNIGLEGKLWTRVIHLLVCVFLKITGAKYRQEYFPDFTTAEESVLSILNTKKAIPITWSCFSNPANYQMWSSSKHHARLVVRIPMRLILGNQRAAISSRRRIVSPCLLRIEAKREERLASASLRVDSLNVMFW